jgi:hypothetical protein
MRRRMSTSGGAILNGGSALSAIQISVSPFVAAVERFAVFQAHFLRRGAGVAIAIFCGILEQLPGVCG